MTPRPGSDRIDHRNAGDLQPHHIGQHITVSVLGGVITGALSDYAPAFETVHLFIDGSVVTVWPSTTVTLGSLDVLGGAAS